MSEAGPGNTTRYKMPTELRQVWAARIIAVILGVATVCAAVADYTDNFPRGFIIVGGVATGVLAVASMLQKAEFDTQQRHDELLDGFTALRLLQARIAANAGEGLGRLAAEVEQVSARTDDLSEALAEVRRRQEQDRTEFDRKITEALEAAFDAGRRYTEAVDGRERKLNAVPHTI